MDNVEQFYQWDERHLAIGELSTSYLENSWDKGSLEFSKTNPIKNLLMLWKYIHHIVREAEESSMPGNELSILLPEHFCQLIWKEFMIWRLQESTQNLSTVSIAGLQV